MNKRKMLTVWICIAAACVLIGLAGAEMYRFLGPNNSYVNITQYLGIGGTDEWAVICNTEYGENGIREDGITYLSLEYVAGTISSRFYYDESLNALCIATPDDIRIVERGGDFRSIAGKNYISAELVRNNYPCDIQQNEDDKITWIWTDYKNEYSERDCKQELKMRASAGIRGEIVSDLNEGDRVICLGEDGKYTRCLTQKGLIGYIKTDELGDSSALKKQYSGDCKESFKSVSSLNKICMGWHMLDIYAADVQTDMLGELIEKENGLNVVSPTWYSITDEAGNISDFSDAEYVSRAADAGIQVWGLVDNFKDELNNLTLLKSHSSRQKLINSLIESAAGCGMSGINIDFESSGAVTGGLNKECGPHFVQFMRELTFEAHKHNLIISVDVPAPYSYNSFFNIEELGRVVDYIIVMGYDEHYSGSEPGSVASYDFVRSAVEKTAASAPGGRIVLGVPFYTRQWTIGTNGEILGTREKGEADLEADLISYNAEVSWLEKERQNYAEFLNEYGLVKVWLDDAVSLKWKMDLIEEFNIAGAAAWRLGVETEEMWKIYSEALS